AIYDYEVPVPEDPFSFRLEIHKCSELFTGSVYRAVMQLPVINTTYQRGKR
ncbi:hypothetical protein CQA09_28600, partial [Klebsiella pneumoniae]